MIHVFWTVLHMNRDFYLFSCFFWDNIVVFVYFLSFSKLIKLLITKNNLTCRYSLEGELKCTVFVDEIKKIGKKYYQILTSEHCNYKDTWQVLMFLRKFRGSSKLFVLNSGFYLKMNCLADMVFARIWKCSLNNQTVIRMISYQCFFVI